MDGAGECASPSLDLSADGVPFGSACRRRSTTESFRLIDWFWFCDSDIPDFLLASRFGGAFRVARSAKLGSVSSLMSDNGLVAVDQGGMPDVDHGGALVL